jgi:hypothetical protein
MAPAGEHHCEPLFVRGRNDLSVVLDPPGWTTAVAPAFATASKPSRNGKNASDAATEPASDRPRPALSSPRR